MPVAIWKGHLQFGLVSLPVRLYTAARGETISFHQLHAPDHSRVRQVLFCQAEDKPVPRNELVKGYEFEKEHYVVLDDEDIRKAAPQTARVMEIQEFVKSDQVDPVFFESSYYLAPEEGGEKPYALLFEALRQSKYFGVAKLSMHNREHVVILRPAAKGLLLHTMYFLDEIRQVEEFRTDLSLVKDRELELAKTLIASLAEDFHPEKYHDAYRENLHKLIEAKVAGRKVVEPPVPKIAPVIDIIEALQQSISSRKKSVQSAGREAARPASAPAETPHKKRAKRKAS